MIEINIKKALHGSNGTMDLKLQLSIKQGEFVALSGESGSGKTTLLRIIAGLEQAEGSIEVNAQRWLENKVSLAPQKRRIGFLFQEYALFENMTVLQNLLFVSRDMPLAKRLLELTALTSLQERYPNTLSGGQKQRVSLCRAMMRRPDILLLDEPLSALNPTMRAKLQQEILTLHKEFAMTTIMVSHDPSEIYKLASRVIVLEQGKIIKDASAKEVLLQTQGSQKFSFKGELLSLQKVDVIFVAIVAIGQQIVEVVVAPSEAEHLSVGAEVLLSTKAFQPSITAL
jgi:molybdate transport system ATP-binding protein